MQPINSQTVESLKGKGHYWTAGALAFALKQPAYYGCHYGMRSDKARAEVAFQAGRG